jgi:hypothetical protein
MLCIDERTIERHFGAGSTLAGIMADAEHDADLNIADLG